VYSDCVTPSAVVRDLRIYLDSDVSMRSQVARTVSHYFCISRQLRSIRRSLSLSVFQSLVGVDKIWLLKCYSCRHPVVGNLRLLQAVINSIIQYTSRHDRVTPLLHRLHWFHTPGRISYKLAVHLYRKCVHGLATAYGGHCSNQDGRQKGGW